MPLFVQLLLTVMLAVPPGPGATRVLLADMEILATSRLVEGLAVTVMPVFVPLPTVNVLETLAVPERNSNLELFAEGNNLRS